MVATLLLTGCGYFTAQPRLEDCEELVETFSEKMKIGNSLMLRAIVRIDSLEKRTEILEDSLTSCQTLNRN